ncbi:transposable element Tcb1 transposase [Trichonephila clavipes]|nr:transposable element Tcb1 transposase [Trichonephila clavipes]
MTRRKQRSAFDQVYEFDRGRIVTYRDYVLSFRENGSRVGRNQTTGKRICDRWMQEMTDRSVTSRTIVQNIQSATHHSVSARTIRRRLHQSGLPQNVHIAWFTLDANHRRLRRQWRDERRMWAAEWNEVVFTDESRI